MNHHKHCNERIQLFTIQDGGVRVCLTCVALFASDKDARADATEKAAQRIEDACKHERVYRGYVLCDACNAAVAAARGEGTE